MGARSLMLIALVNDNDRIGNLVSVDASPIHSTTSGGIDFMLNTLDALLAVDLDTLSPTNNLNEGRKVLLEILTKNGVASELLRQSLAMKLVKDKGEHSIRNKKTIINDPFDQTQSPVSSDNYFHLNVVLFFAILKNV